MDRFRAMTDGAIDGMMDAIHMVADMRASLVEEETIAVAMSERVSLIKITIEQRLDEWENPHGACRME